MISLKYSKGLYEYVHHCDGLIENCWATKEAQHLRALATLTDSESELSSWIYMVPHKHP